MLLPWWAIQLHWHITWLDVARLPRRRRLRRGVPLPAASRRPGAALIVLVYWLVAAKPIWYGPYPYGVKQAGAGALFQGIRGVRAGLDRPRRAGRRGRRRPLDEPQRPLHGEPERVLQPQRRPGLLHRPPDRWRRWPSCPVAVDRRTGTVRLADGSAGPSRLPADRRLRGAGRHPRRPRPGARDDGLEGRTGRSSSRRRASPASTRTTRGPALASPGRGSTAAAAPSPSRSRETRSCCPTATPCRRPPAPASTSSPTRRPPSASRSPRAAARARWSFNIAPTAVPSEVIPGSKDDRELGAHFNAFAYRP